MAVYRNVADDVELQAALDHEIDDLVRRFDRGEHSTVTDWEYLLLTARKRG